MEKMRNKNEPCQGYRLVPYGASASGTVPCEHRRRGMKCPDADKPQANTEEKHDDD